MHGDGMVGAAADEYVVVVVVTIDLGVVAAAAAAPAPAPAPATTFIGVGDVRVVAVPTDVCAGIANFADDGDTLSA